jgi:predicted GIY-YIG superfamily endonuclease
VNYVYLLQSEFDSTHRFIGITSREIDVKLADHNAGKSTCTNQHRPWKIVAHFAFDQQRKAKNFERYLKQGSGQSFANRHLWQKFNS